MPTMLAQQGGPVLRAFSERRRNARAEGRQRCRPAQVEGNAIRDRSREPLREQARASQEHLRRLYVDGTYTSCTDGATADL
jgi:hypothetical protein